jgi:hypothetical protein
MLLAPSTQSQGQYQQGVSGNPGTRQAGQQPQQADRDRAGLPGPAQRAISNPDPANDKEREIRDLAAQEATATFTFWIVVIALAQTIVAGIGIVYIRRTIRQGQAGLKLARETKDETIRIGEAQTRAYLSVVRADLLLDRKKRFWADTPSTDLTLHLHNSGETPAVNVSYYCSAGVSTWRNIGVVPDTDTVPNHEFITNIPPGDVSKIEAVGYGISLHLRAVMARWKEFTQDTPIGDAPILLVYGVVFYEDVFGNTFRSRFGFWLEEQPTEGKLLKGRDDLPTIQACIPTFEPIRDRTDHIKRNEPEEDSEDA